MGDSIWSDVSFDGAAANAALDALDRAATQLDQASMERAVQAKHAQEDWLGATRAQFDQTLEPALRQAGELVEALRRAAGTIRQAVTEAATEQERRKKLRSEVRRRGGTEYMEIR